MIQILKEEIPFFFTDFSSSELSLFTVCWLAAVQHCAHNEFIHVHHIQTRAHSLLSVHKDQMT